MDQNEVLFDRAQKSIPGGVNSPVRAFRSVGGAPRFIKKALGPHMYDVEGKQYIDYIGSWGPMILGHNNPHVIEAVKEAVDNGLSFGAPTVGEIDIAEEIKRLIPSVEEVRLVSSGTEAGMSAIRTVISFFLLPASRTFSQEYKSVFSVSHRTAVLYPSACLQATNSAIFAATFSRSPSTIVSFPFGA